MNRQQICPVTRELRNELRGTRRRSWPLGSFAQQRASEQFRCPREVSVGTYTLWRCMQSGAARNRGLKSAGSVLKRTQPELIVSKRKLGRSRALSWSEAIGRKGVRICALARDRSYCAAFRSGHCQKGQFCTSAEMEISSCRSPDTQSSASRLDKIESYPFFSPHWRCGRRVRRSGSGARLEMLETFGMQKGGTEYRRLIAAFERIFGATMFFGTESMRRRPEYPAVAVQLPA